MAGNPRCWCQTTSRIGVRNKTREQWFHCPVGKCGFKEDVPAGYGAGWNNGVAGPPGYAVHSAQPGQVFEMDANPYEAQALQNGADRGGGCCCCVVM